MFNYYIFGIQRSGTTFLEFTLAKTFGAKFLNSHGTWKHSVAVPDIIKSTDDLSLVIFKNPYTWLESILFRDSADLIDNVPEYELRLVNESSVNLGHENLNLHKAVALYVAYARGWLAAADRLSVQVIRYEDMFSPAGLDKISQKLPIGRGLIDWQFPESGSLFMSEGFDSSRISYYVNQRPVQLTASQVEIVNSILPDDLMEKLGYTKINC